MPLRVVHTAETLHHNLSTNQCIVNIYLTITGYAHFIIFQSEIIIKKILHKPEY